MTSRKHKNSSSSNSNSNNSSGNNNNNKNKTKNSRRRRRHRKTLLLSHRSALVAAFAFLVSMHWSAVTTTTTTTTTSSVVSSSRIFPMVAAAFVHRSSTATAAATAAKNTTKRTTAAATTRACHNCWGIAEDGAIPLEQRQGKRQGQRRWNSGHGYGYRSASIGQNSPPLLGRSVGSPLSLSSSSSVTMRVRSSSFSSSYLALPTATWTSLWMRPPASSPSLDDSDDENKNNNTNHNTNTNTNHDKAFRLSVLRDELIRLSGGKTDFNPNSPAQRSMAIFGEVRSCTRKILEDVAGGQGQEHQQEHQHQHTKSQHGDPRNDYGELSDDRRLLARYIVEFQELSKELQLQQQQQQQSARQPERTLGEQGAIVAAEVSGGSRPAPPTAAENPGEPEQGGPPGRGDDGNGASESESESALESESESASESMRGRVRRRRPPRARPETYEEIVDKLFAPTGLSSSSSSYASSCRLDPYWKEPLLELNRPVARDLVRQLNPELCPMGYDPDWTASGTPSNSNSSKNSGPKRGKRVGFLGYCRDQKEIYPRHVVLVRCGDFYETFGIDAILLVEHVGLNPMGGKARSGCPKQNIQATLDGLTSQGFSVAVYEEIEPLSIHNNNKKSSSNQKKLKERSLAQIVSPAAPTYLYDNWLLDANHNSHHGNDASHALDGLPPPRPCVGVVHTAAGYNLVEVSLEERSVRYSERLTSEAVACRLEAYPPADPLFYVPSLSERQKGSLSLPFLPRRRTAGSSSSSSSRGRGRLGTKILDPHLVPEPVAGKSDADRYVRVIVDAILQRNELPQPAESAAATTTTTTTPTTNRNNRTTSVADFTVTMGSTTTNPLYVETATQLGLMDDSTIPSLIRHVLDDAAPASSRRFLERYLLIPPPPSVALSMARVVRTLTDKESSLSLPPLSVPNLGKSLILIRAGQAGANVYGELLQSLDTTKYVLEMHDDDGDDTAGRTNETTNEFVEALLHMCEHESGLPARRESLLEGCQKAIDAIEAVVSSSFHVEEDYACISTGGSLPDVVSRDEYIPQEFFERNEKTWRGRVQQSVAADAYQRVRIASQQLAKAVREDFIGTNENNKSLIKYNYFDNLVSLQKKPSDGLDNALEFVHPYDRFGKVLSNRWTTEKVKQAVSHYVSECDNATNEVACILSDLAQNLQDDGHIPAIVQSSHFNLILSTAFHHAVKATNAGWQLATTIEDNPSSEAQFVDVYPYWMHRSKAVTNTFDLSSMILLTAPNMSGKSTLMRSTAAAALLTICGLCAPLSCESRISRFDTLFLRGASADVPTEDKSAFGAEMGNLAALFRCSGPRSFVFVDELGRGTSPRDGTRLAGAVLERMAESGMSGVFATHLHDVLDLPLRKERIVTKRIRIDRNEDGDGSSYTWTHKLEDGRCTDSMALLTAERFGLPEDILRRARELTQFILERTTPCVNSGDVEMDGGTQSRKQDGDPRAVPSSEDEALHDLDAELTDERLNEIQDEWLKEFLGVRSLASALLEETNDGTYSIDIPPRHLPPASLANRSCLYIIQLLPPVALSSSSPPPVARYYVGETDSIAKRLSQHRKKDNSWFFSKTVVFPVGNKSQARYIESALIGEMSRAGYALESIVDGRALRHLRD